MYYITANIRKHKEMKSPNLILHILGLSEHIEDSLAKITETETNDSIEHLRDTLSMKL